MKSFVDVGLPLLGCTELFIFHQLELIGCNVTIQRVNRELIFEIHSESFLLEWETKEYIFDSGRAKFIHEFFKLFRLGFFDTLGHHDELLDEADLLD